MTIKTSGILKMSDIIAEFGNYGAPYKLSQFYRGGGKVPNSAGNANIPTNGLIRFSHFYGATRVTLFPDSFYMTVYLYDSYGGRYLYTTVNVTHSTQAVLSGYSANVSIQALTNPAGVGFTTNSLGEKCEYFDCYTNTHRGCQNGNQQTWYVTFRARALPGGYETYILSSSMSQSAC